MKTTIGIDPGLSGGIAHKIEGGRVCATSMPDTEGDLVDYLRSITAEDDCEAYIEELTGYAGVAIPSHTMFKLGRNVGIIHGTLQALGVRIVTVTPQNWQKGLSLGSSRGLKKSQWKAHLRAKAQQLFPTVKVTQKTADALLILEYALTQKKV